MKHETFSDNSNNPRLRRAFAHAKLAQLAQGADVRSEAQQAVEAVGTSRKSVNSNFGRALIKASVNGSSERHRQQVVAERGLSADASWSDITADSSERHRQQVVAERGLSADASWSDITATSLAQIPAEATLHQQQ